MNSTKTRLIALLIAIFWSGSFALAWDPISINFQTTRIASASGQSTSVTIYLYNDLGQLVGTLPEVPAVGVSNGPGSYLSISYEGDEITSGIYSFAIDVGSTRYWSDFKVIVLASAHSIPLEAFNNTDLPQPYLFDKSLVVEGSVEMLGRVFNMGNTPGGQPAFSLTIAGQEDQTIRNISSLPHARWEWEGSTGLYMSLQKEFGNDGNPILAVGGSRVLTASDAGLKLAVGSTVLASGTNSLASGNNVTASGTHSGAFGLGTTAQGYNQFVVGQYNTPLGAASANTNSNDPLFIVGNGTSTATADRSNAFIVQRNGDVRVAGKLMVGNGASAADGAIAAIGSNAEASGIDSVALGRYSKASGEGSSVLGTGSWATGPGAVALGPSAYAYGSGSLAMGNNAEATADESLVFGQWSYAYGLGSLSIGMSSLASGDFSVTAGMGNYAGGQGSVAIGESVVANAKGQVALGRYSAPSGSPSVEAPTDDLLIIGNGTDATHRSNAFTLKKNGDVNVAGKLRVWPSGDLGMGTFKSGTKPSVGVDPEP